MSGKDGMNWWNTGRSIRRHDAVDLHRSLMGVAPCTCADNRTFVNFRTRQFFRDLATSSTHRHPVKFQSDLQLLSEVLNGAFQPFRQSDLRLPTQMLSRQ